MSGMSKVTPAGQRLTAAEARRIAIAAQQLGAPVRPAAPPVNRGHLARLLNAIGLLQVDSVNVLARAHLLPIFSRLGPYPVSVLHDAAWPERPHRRMLLESWAHVASLIPVDTEPLLRYRQRHFAKEHWPRVDAANADHPWLLDKIRSVVAEQGPVSAGQIEKILEAPGRGRPGWWDWSATKSICEYLFLSGELAVAHRKGFERHYDLVERVVPAAVLAVPTPDEAEAHRQLLARAARHHGVGTAGDLADYYRIPTLAARRALADLVDAGVVEPVRVDGWAEPAYLHAEARIPRRVTGTALLCPFDPLIWERSRTERLFGVRYRIEIYVPAPKRVYGYYVFPLLLGDAIVGRFDLKADRAASRLLVQASWLEPGADREQVAAAAAAELARMAGWLGLRDLVVVDRGDLAATLQRLVGSTLSAPATPPTAVPVPPPARG